MQLVYSARLHGESKEASGQRFIHENNFRPLALSFGSLSRYKRNLNGMGSGESAIQCCEAATAVSPSTASLDAMQNMLGAPRHVLIESMRARSTQALDLQLSAAQISRLELMGMPTK